MKKSGFSIIIIFLITALIAISSGCLVFKRNKSGGEAQVSTDRDKTQDNTDDNMNMEIAKGDTKLLNEVPPSSSEKVFSSKSSIYFDPNRQDSKSSHCDFLAEEEEPPADTKGTTAMDVSTGSIKPLEEPAVTPESPQPTTSATESPQPVETAQPPENTQDRLPVDVVEGTLTDVIAGNDSGQIKIKTDSSTITMSIRSNIDWMNNAQFKQYKELMKKTPGKTWPTIVDQNSKVRAWYVKRNEKCNLNFLLKYELLDSPANLWIVIIASEKDSPSAVSEKNEAASKGLASDIIKSDDYSSLKPGYHVVIIGAYNDKKSAVAMVKNAGAKGYKDAYIKKVR